MSAAPRLVGVRGYPRMVLDWLAEEFPSGQAVATAQIADKCGIWLNDVHSCMFNLVASAYMEKIADPADARRTMYRITPAGVEHSKLLGKLPAIPPVKLGAVHRRHKAQLLADTQADSRDDSGMAAEVVGTIHQPVTPVEVKTEPVETGECLAPCLDEADDWQGLPEAALPTINDAAPDAHAQRNALHTARRSAGDSSGTRPVFAIGPTGQVRVILPRPGVSVYLQPDVLHKLAAAAALVRQAGGLA